MRCAAVILLQLDGFCAREILFKAQNVRNLRPAPRIDALVVITDTADVFAFLRQQPQPEILDSVGILIFINKDIFELRLIFFEDVPVIFQQVQAMQQQIAKVAGVQGQQSRLIQRIHVPPLAIGKSFIVGGVQIGG